MPTIREQLKDFLETSKNWEKMETPLQGVFVVKVPGTKNLGARLSLEINPLNEYGRSLKKNGLYISNLQMLIGFAEALSDDKTYHLIQYLDLINKRKPTPIVDFQGLIEPSIEPAEEENIEEVEDIKESENTGEEEEDIEEVNIEYANIELEPLVEEDLEEDLEEDSVNSERLYVDITNIMYSDKDRNGKLKVNNIQIIYQTLKFDGYDPILIADASTVYKMNDKEQFEELISKKIILLAPSGRTADIYVLKLAQKRKCNFLSNDMFRDYYDEFGKEWIREHRLTCMFEDGELIID